jgi:hypothetical protein
MPETDPASHDRNALARTKWRRWAFRGFVGITVFIALVFAVIDPFLLGGQLQETNWVWFYPPLLFLGMMLGLAWLAMLTMSQRTRHSDREVEKMKEGHRDTHSGSAQKNR